MAEVNLWSLTIPQLKDILRVRGLPLGGNKSELIGRLQTAGPQVVGGAAQKMTIPQLKEKLRSRNLPVGGNKAELIARLSVIPSVTPRPLSPVRPTLVPLTAPRPLSPARPTLVPLTAPRPLSPRQPTVMPVAVPRPLSPARPTLVPLTAPHPLSPARQQPLKPWTPEVRLPKVWDAAYITGYSPLIRVTDSIVNGIRQGGMEIDLDIFGEPHTMIYDTNARGWVEKGSTANKIYQITFRDGGGVNYDWPYPTGKA